MRDVSDCGPSSLSVSQDAAASHAATFRQGVCRLAVFSPARLLPGRILQLVPTGAGLRCKRSSLFLLKIRHRHRSGCVWHRICEALVVGCRVDVPCHPAATTLQRKERVLTMRSTEEILGNVIWLIDALDDAALAEVQDLPFLEMAKDITIASVSSQLSADGYRTPQGGPTLRRRREDPS